MADLLLLFAAILLLNVGGSLARVVLGPSRADRIMGAQLMGTNGVAILLLLAAAANDPAAIDVALVVALLAAFAAVAFVKGMSAEGASDPESAERP